ncbi:hypothetical protein SGUI_3045 [Serinicoccus hydrothermalis]|uniref:Uncharacterized protein n=2 Tax=Ornithinimicrobiaceae TaxID=2805590 RepID=A0A1B1NGB8_9MICO|nr:hypothetical protein SGUI_3045 [Serinicoccus hydrothermalis]
MKPKNASRAPELKMSAMRCSTMMSFRWVLRGRVEQGTGRPTGLCTRVPQTTVRACSQSSRWDESWTDLYLGGDGGHASCPRLRLWETGREQSTSGGPMSKRARKRRDRKKKAANHGRKPNA